MGFLKKKKSHQASPSSSQGGKNFGITISPAQAFSSAFARSLSSATVLDDARNDVGSDARSLVSNHSRADVIIMPASNASTHANNYIIAMASPLSEGSGREVIVCDKPSASASTNATTVTTVESTTVLTPPFPTIAKKKIGQQLALGTTMKEGEQRSSPLPRHGCEPPPKITTMKSEKTQIHASKAVGSNEGGSNERGILSESSCSQSMSDDDERESFSDDDDRTESETERSLVSLGYRTSHSRSTSFGISQSTSSENTDFTSLSDEDEEEEREVNRSRQNISKREHRDLIEYVSETDTSMSSLGGVHSKAKKCLKKLNTLASKAKNESNAARINSASNVVRGVPTSAQTTKGKEKSTTTRTRSTFSPPEKNTEADSAASTDANSSNASTSTAMFLKVMEEYTVKNADNQLLLKVNEHGNVQRLTLHEIVGIPTPGRPTDVVIKVNCSTITLQDCMIRRGHWYVMQNLPFIPGSEIVGTILSLGSDAANNSPFQIGDKVASIVRSGGNAKYITLHYESIIRVPADVEDTTALSMLANYVPARESLDLARKWNTPLTGANVLIIGGNGPSGLAMIELALLEAAHVYTTADERHHAHLTSLGVKCFPINPEKWLPMLQGKMDVVLDSVCIDMYDSSQKALNATGTLVCTGMSAVYTMGRVGAFGLQDVRDYKAGYCKMKAKYFMYNGVYYDKMERFNTAKIEFVQHFRYLCHLASKGTVTPAMSTSVPLKSVASVQRAIELGDTAYGVCVCKPWAGHEDATWLAKASGDSGKASSN